MLQSERQDSRGISRREAGKLRREKEKHFRQSLPSIDSSVSFARSITTHARLKRAASCSRLLRTTLRGCREH